nr:hypothetical protein [Tanacetum cinerariifolium]
MIGVSRGGTPPVAPHSNMRQGLGHGRIVKANMAREADGPGQNNLVEHKDVEPCEITSQLKNATWKEPLKEINQLQKMSLSDSKEQNKNDIDGEDGYNQFQKSSPAWCAADYFERFSPELRMAEVRPYQEWVISHTCTTCGVLDYWCRMLLLNAT